MAKLTNVQLEATRSSEEPANVWVMRIRYTPVFSAGEKAEVNPKHTYQVIARLSAENGMQQADVLALTSSLVFTGTTDRPHLTIDDHNRPKSFTFKMQGAVMSSIAAFDGGPATRADLRASVEIIDKDLNVTKDNEFSPELTLSVPAGA
jgi:hypothetical protein